MGDYRYRDYNYNSTHNRISRNTCNNNNYSGINLSSAHRNTIVMNICTDNGDHGIFLDAESRGCTLSDNDCRSNGKADILLETYPSSKVDVVPWIIITVVLFVLVMKGPALAGWLKRKRR